MLSRLLLTAYLRGTSLWEPLFLVAWLGTTILHRGRLKEGNGLWGDLELRFMRSLTGGDESCRVLGWISSLSVVNILPGMVSIMS